jgi:hypothetical protein
MTAAPPRAFHSASKIDQSALVQARGKVLEKSFRKSSSARSAEDAEREWFASLLKSAFPEANSDNELAEIAAEVLTTEKRPVTARTVRNWLGCHNAPHFRYVLKVIALAGTECIFQIIDPELSE